ncbi:hypothetical protein LY76DRAFT_639976 [Colletotrichum caudatum]|nr:hypothetical protein LY76DRAFT_639976 [Colletotrichum caudatum]
MSFQDFHGSDQIEKELIAQNLIAIPPPPPPMPKGPSTDAGVTGHVRALIEVKSMTTQQAIYGIFKTTQHGAAAWNTHPAVRLVVEWIKKKLTDPSWQGRELNTVIFSDIASTPDQFIVGGIDSDRIKRGGAALLIKSIYNTKTEYDDNIQLEKCNTGIADLNSYIWDNKISFLIMWYRQNFNMWPTDNTTWQRHLAGCKSYHFVKLAACGATDEQINGIYQEMTTVVPILDGSTFGEIYANHWRTYDAWITKGYLDFGDLGATKLDSWHAYPFYFPGQMPTFSYLAVDVIRHYDYWKSAPSSSCFSASTRVLMASGEVKMISEVTPGESVLFRPSDTKDGGKSRTVAFVSKPKRAGRRLYELQSFPGIQFTETHPLLLESNDESRIGSFPVLQFVNKLLAASLNPIWQSFETVRIDPHGIIMHNAAKDLDEELLYDLIFEPVATKGGSTSTQLYALSEAPLIEWFPLEMIFVGNVVQAISRTNLSIENLISSIDNHQDSLRSLLRTVAGTDISQHSVNTITGATLDSLLPKDEHNEAQNKSDLIEKFIMRLGWTISKEISRGWLKPPTLLASESDSVDVVFAHVLRRLGDDPNGKNGPLSNSWTASVNAESRSTPRVRLDGRVQGHNIMVLHEGIVLPPPLQQKTPKTGAGQPVRSVQIEIMDCNGDNSWSTLSMGNLAAEGSGNHAVLEVELRTVPRVLFETRWDWEEEDRVKYAANLGYAFGLKLIQLLQTGNSHVEAEKD